MLRIGLTGDLGSGKSTVATMLAARGAIVFSSDEMARNMMQPGEHVYAQIIQHFGNEVLTVDRLIDRTELAKIVFTENRLDELEAIVHPAVIAQQAKQIATIASHNPDAIVVIESALLFTTKHGLQGKRWQDRFDRILLVTAPEDTKIARYVQRASQGSVLSPEKLAADARRRLATQHNDKYAAECLVIANDADEAKLERRVDAIWRELTNPNR